MLAPPSVKWRCALTPRRLWRRSFPNRPPTSQAALQRTANQVLGGVTRLRFPEYLSNLLTEGGEPFLQRHLPPQKRVEALEQKARSGSSLRCSSVASTDAKEVSVVAAPLRSGPVARRAVDLCAGMEGACRLLWSLVIQARNPVLEGCLTRIAQSVMSLAITVNLAAIGPWYLNEGDFSPVARITSAPRICRGLQTLSTAQGNVRKCGLEHAS